MKRKLSQKWLIALISFLLAPALYMAVMACADIDYDFKDNSNFAPEVFVKDTTLAPFFYSEMFYYGDNYYETPSVMFNQTNVSEWKGYLKNTVDSAIIDFYLNSADENAVGVTYNGYTGKADMPDSLLQYADKLNRNNSRQRLFMRYLTFAKQAEVYANTHYNYWDYDPDKKTVPESELGGLYDGIATSFADTKDIFVKERYWFQLVRFFYFYNPGFAPALFYANQALFPKDNMYYRTMSYAAGALKKNGEIARANYYYSIVFNRCPAMRTVAHWSFSPQEEADWRQTLALCKTADEQCALWQMLGIFYGDEIRSMKEIYKLNPVSDKLDVLLTRFVNEAESDYNPWSFDGWELTVKMDSTQRLNHVIEGTEWVRKVINEGQVSNKFLWDVSAGYLCFLMKDNDKAADYYELASQQVNDNDTLAAQQLRLLCLINNVGATERITANYENALLNDLKWLFAYEAHDWVYPKPVFRTAHAINRIRQIMAKKYASQGNTVKSECFLSDNVFYTKPANVTAYRKFFERTDLTPYDKFCQGIADKRLKDVYEFQAIKLALTGKNLHEALVLFERCDADTLPADPFYATISDDHDRDQAAPQAIKYTKTSLIKKLIKHEKAVEAGKDVYNNALLLGNAFYNISFYGNNRAFFDCKILNYNHTYWDFQPNNPYGFDYRLRPLMIDNSVAYRYYTLALKAAKTREQKARALFMMAKCERNEWYNMRYYVYNDNEYHNDWSDDNRIDFITWKSFNALRKYKNTEYYKQAIAECGYFATAM